MQQVDAKGIGWDKVEERVKISHDLLKLYANSGPVPVTIVSRLEKFLEGRPTEHVICLKRKGREGFSHPRGDLLSSCS